MRVQKRDRIRSFGLILCVAFLFMTTGCQKLPAPTSVQSSQGMDFEEEINGEGFVGEEKYEQNFKKPEINANIFVDLKGYTPEDKKQAYFLGKNLSREFFVYDSEDKKLVYTGELKDMGKQTPGGKSVYKGDFSGLTKPGSYYIQTAVIGQSYTFTIGKDRYKEQLTELEQEFLKLTPAEYYEYETGEEDRIQILYSFQKLATAYAFFSEQYGEDYAKKLAEHAQWLLSERELVLEKRAQQQTPDYTNPDSGEQLVVEEDYMFASAMGAGYMVLQPDNRQLASQMLSQAQKAYQNASKYNCKELVEMQYMAAASLYRITGSYSYRNVITNQYAGAEEVSKEQENYSDNMEFWGNLFYMTTQRNVDTEICSQQMKELMNMCGEYSSYSSKSIWGLASEGEDPLECGIRLTMADYIIVSREYRDVCKAQIHYLLYDAETADLEHGQKSALLLITGNLVEREATE